MGTLVSPDHHTRRQQEHRYQRERFVQLDNIGFVIVVNNNLMARHRFNATRPQIPKTSIHIFIEMKQHLIYTKCDIQITRKIKQTKKQRRNVINKSTRLTGKRQQTTKAHIT